MLLIFLIIAAVTLIVRLIQVESSRSPQKPVRPMNPVRLRPTKPLTAEKAVRQEPVELYYQRDGKAPLRILAIESVMPGKSVTVSQDLARVLQTRPEGVLFHRPRRQVRWVR